MSIEKGKKTQEKGVTVTISPGAVSPGLLSIYYVHVQPRGIHLCLITASDMLLFLQPYCNYIYAIVLQQGVLQQQCTPNPQ